MPGVASSCDAAFDSRRDNAVCAYERYSHFIATDRDRETIPEGPRLLDVGLRDVRDDVAETVVRDDDAFEASLPFLRHAEVQVDEVLDDRPDVLHLRTRQEMGGGGGEQVSTVERVRKFRPAQFPVRDLPHLFQAEALRCGNQ